MLYQQTREQHRAIEREQGYIIWLEKSLAAMEQECK